MDADDKPQRRGAVPTKYERGFVEMCFFFLPLTVPFAVLLCVADCFCVRFYAVIVSKWQTEINCLVHSRVQLDERAGTFDGIINTWMPLPDPRPPPMAQLP